MVRVYRGEDATLTEAERDCEDVEEEAKNHEFERPVPNEP